MTWMQTWSGRVVDLVNPTPEMIDLLTDVPEMLARISRFNGATMSGIWSVAQHCVLVSDAILYETGDLTLAAYGLLHDAPEFALGDETTPQQQAAVAVECERFGATHSTTRHMAVRRIMHWRMEAAIHRAAGLPTSASEQAQRIIKTFDIRALATERRQLMAPCTRPWSQDVENAEPIRMRGKLKIKPPAVAAEEWRDRLISYCPKVAEAHARKIL